jgi:lipopolysaccharide export system protein LptA
MKSKLITIACIAAIILGIFVYKDNQLIHKTSTEKGYILQKNIQSIGYDNGKKVFDIKISELLQHNTPYILYAKSIEKGQIFNHEGQPIIIELEGKGGRINTRQKSISITQNAQAIIHPTTSEQTLHVSSNAFKYNHDKKESQFYNQTTLIVNDTTITSPEFNYSNNNERLVFPKGFNLSAKNSITDTTDAILNINTATITASNNVKTVYKKAATKTDSSQIKALLNHETTIEAKNMVLNYKNEENPTIHYTDDVVIHQPDKSLKSDALILNFKENQYIAKKNIRMTFNNLQWALQKKRIIQNKEIKNMLTKKTYIKAQHASYNKQKNHILFSKSVELKQNSFKLTCDDFTYDIDAELITMTGNVKIYKFGIEYLTSTKIIINIKNETLSIASKKELSEITLEI